MEVRQSILINRPPEELYSFWRDFRNLPKFMRHLESVETDLEPISASSSRARSTKGTAAHSDSPQSGTRSHWVVKAPGGTVEWDAEITEDRPGQLIAWRSLAGSDINNGGSIRFKEAPAGRGTMVEVEIQYDPPAGKLGKAVAKLFGEEPDWQVKDDLRRFKQLMETGEILTTEGQPAGRDSSTSRKYDTAIRHSD